MRPSTNCLALSALALAALTASTARGDFLTTSMDTSTPIMTFNIPSAGVNGESGYVGPNTITFDGSGPVQAYCTDLFRSIGVNDGYDAKFAPLSDLANGVLVAKILGVDAASGDTSALEKAAVQLAIWDVIETGRAGLGSYTDPFAFSPQRVDRASDHVDVYGDDARTTLLFGLSSSSLIVDAADGSGVLNRMDALLVSASNLAGPGPDVIYIEPTGSYGQGFVSLRSVPEPSSLILSFIGVTGFVGYQLRRRCRGMVA
jgi:PEP-CTERM motif